jgi:hypothetical protein
VICVSQLRIYILRVKYHVNTFMVENKCRVPPLCTVLVCEEVVLSVSEKCLAALAWDFECYVSRRNILVEELRALIHKVSCHRLMFS